MARAKPKPSYKIGDVLETQGYYIPNRYVVVEVVTFQNKYVLDFEDHTKRNDFSRIVEGFWLVHNPDHYQHVISPLKLWRQLNE